MCEHTTIFMSAVKGNVRLQLGAATRNNAAVNILTHVSWTFWVFLDGSLGYVIEGGMFWPWSNVFSILAVSVRSFSKIVVPICCLPKQWMRASLIPHLCWHFVFLSFFHFSHSGEYTMTYWVDFNFNFPDFLGDWWSFHEIIVYFKFSIFMKCSFKAPAHFSVDLYIFLHGFVEFLVCLDKNFIWWYILQSIFSPSAAYLFTFFQVSWLEDISWFYHPLCFFGGSFPYSKVMKIVKLSYRNYLIS